MLIVRTKLHRPQAMANIVCRGRLHALMNRGLEVPLTLLAAPAGYGKSVLVSHWADSVDHPVAWISLDESDSDLTQFFDYLAAALDQALPDAFPKILDLAGAGQLPAIQNLAGRLINELDRLDAPFVLVLDDYHRIEPTSTVHTLWSQLLQHPPRHLHLILIGRRDPPLPVWTLRSASMLNEIRMQDLCFLDEEVAELLANTTPTAIGTEAIRQLQGELEGWAAGLRLVSLALRQIRDPSLLLANLKGGIQHAQDYLLHEILAQQPAELRQCLLRSSIFECFCPALIDAVCLWEMPSAGAPTSGREIVESLLRSELFTVGLDARGEWFRFHPLFRDLLRAQLAQVSTDREFAELNLRASAWFETQDLITESIEHALAAKDETLAAELVERHAQTEFAADRWYVVDHWLAILPIEIRRRRSKLLLTEAWVRNLQHQLARVPALIDEAEALLSAGGSMTEPDQAVTGLIAYLRGFLAYYEGAGERSLRYLEDAVGSAVGTRTWFSCDAEMFLGLARCMVGQHDQAVATLRTRLNETDASQTYLLSRLLGGLIFLHLLSGELHAARAQARRLAYMATTRDMRLNMAWSRYALGCTHLHAGELESALQQLEQAVEMRYLLEPLAAVDAMAGLALTSQLIGRDDNATMVCDQLQGFAQELNEDEYLAVAQSCRARIELLRGETASARRWALSLEAKPEPHNLFLWMEVPQITAARILIGDGSPAALEQAQELLSSVRKRSAECRFQCQLIEISVLEVLALELQNEHDGAAVALDKVIALARPGGWLRPFLESGASLTSRLERLREQNSDDEFIDRILHSLGCQQPSSAIRRKETGTGPETPVAIDALNLETLTNRELDIVDLLAQRLHSKEIADRLFISTHTVNAHLKRIYRKLGVNSRREAVERAARAGLVNSR